MNLCCVENKEFNLLKYKDMLYDVYDVEVLADRLEEEMEVINEMNKLMDIREQCRERAIEFAKEWGYEEVSSHILDIMVSIMCTRDKSSYAGGGFVEAVVANNLYLAMSRADSECRNNIFLLTMCNMNCYV
jgi:hypothetical protein